MPAEQAERMKGKSGQQGAQKGTRERDAGASGCENRPVTVSCARKRERRTRGIRYHRWRSAIGHAAGTSLKQRALDACPGSRRDETGRQREEGLPKQLGKRSQERWPRGSVPCPVRRVPGGAGGAVEYRVEEGGGRLGAGLQRFPGKAEVSGHSRVGERPAERRRRQG